jgi:hypothetical protein
VTNRRDSGPSPGSCAKIIDMELRPFGMLTLGLGSEGLHLLGATPVGTRIIQEIVSARLEGERVNASLRGNAAADWLSVDAQGVATFDIRMTLETDDGAVLYLSYEGRADWSEGMGKAPVYVAMRFEAGDERYRWLNALQPVGKGTMAEGGGLLYEICELV